MNAFERLIQWINANPGKALGAFVGFILAVLIFTIGPLITFIVLLFTAVGYFIGKLRDDGGSISDGINKFFNSKKDE